MFKNEIPGEIILAFKDTLCCTEGLHDHNPREGRTRADALKVVERRSR